MIADVLLLFGMAAFCITNAQGVWFMFVTFKDINLLLTAIFVVNLWATAVVAIDVWQDDNCHGNLAYTFWHITAWVMIMVGLWRRYGPPFAKP